MKIEETVGEYLNGIKKNYKKQFILHFCIAIFCVIFLNFIVTHNTKQTIQLHNIMKFAIPVFCIICLFWSASWFKKKIDFLCRSKKLLLSQKLYIYKKALYYRWAIISIPIYLSTIILLLTSQLYYSIFIFLPFVFLILYSPSKEQLIYHLQLNETDQNLLNDYYTYL